jgi:hypothetical protein
MRNRSRALREAVIHAMADEREHAEPEAAADLPLVLGLCLLA